jgi:hypothetical protein
MKTLLVVGSLVGSLFLATTGMADPVRPVNVENLTNAGAAYQFQAGGGFKVYPNSPLPTGTSEFAQDWKASAGYVLFKSLASKDQCLVEMQVNQFCWKGVCKFFETATVKSSVGNLCQASEDGKTLQLVD